MKSVILAEDFLLEAIAKKLMWNATVNRANSITKAFATMLGKLRDTCAVALLDDDSTITAPYSKLFTQEVAAENGLLVRRSEEITLHSVIIVHPASEKWLWNAAESAGVKASDYELGHSMEELKTFTKGEQMRHNPDIPRFLSAVSRAQPAQFLALQKWLQREISRTL